MKSEQNQAFGYHKLSFLSLQTDIFLIYLESNRKVTQFFYVLLLGTIEFLAQSWSNMLSQSGVLLLCIITSDRALQS